MCRRPRLLPGITLCAGLASVIACRIGLKTAVWCDAVREERTRGCAERVEGGDGCVRAGRGRRLRCDCLLDESNWECHWQLGVYICVSWRVRIGFVQRLWLQPDLRHGLAAGRLPPQQPQRRRPGQPERRRARRRRLRRLRSRLIDGGGRSALGPGGRWRQRQQRLWRQQRQRWGVARGRYARQPAHAAVRQAPSACVRGRGGGQRARESGRRRGPGPGRADWRAPRPSGRRCAAAAPGRAAARKLTGPSAESCMPALVLGFDGPSASRCRACAPCAAYVMRGGNLRNAAHGLKQCVCAPCRQRHFDPCSPLRLASGTPKGWREPASSCVSSGAKQMTCLESMGWTLHSRGRVLRQRPARRMRAAVLRRTPLKGWKHDLNVS